MNFDELVAVWQTQERAPLHGVDRTLLHLALRQDDAKLQRARRRERWILYIACAGIVVGMAVFSAIILYSYESNGLTGWDLLVPAVGVVAAIFAARSVYMNHRAQSRIDQSFGESLRDQVLRGLAQIEDQMTRARRATVLVTVLLGGICPATILLLSWRINQKPIADDGYMLVMLLLLCIWSVVTGVKELRRQERALEPRRRRLEEVLGDLEEG